MEAKNELKAIHAAVQPFVKEAQRIIACQLADSYQVDKIRVKFWRALAATFGEDEKVEMSE
jgi:hypothetical protein